MVNDLRFLVLYGSQADPVLAEHSVVVPELVHHFGANPSRAAFFYRAEGKYGKWKRRRISRSANLTDIIEQAACSDSIALDEPVSGNFLNVKSHIAFSFYDNVYLAAREKSVINDNLIIGHIKLCCKYLTPKYGFSTVASSPIALSFPYGISSTSMDIATTRRVGDLGQSLSVTHEHLNGKIFDVYSINILSELHVSQAIGSATLSDWILSENCGKLSSIKKGVFVWYVPENVREKARDVLFREGMFISSGY